MHQIAFSSFRSRPGLFAFILTSILAVTAPCVGQEIPSKILGYKVHDEIIRISNIAPADENSPYVKVTAVKLDDVGLTGLTLTVDGEATVKNQSGRVERLLFREFQVNGVPVQVENFEAAFSLNRNGPTSLPLPVKIFLQTQNALKVAWNEMNDPKKEWVITGRVLVLGKFKKLGFSFRRAVPVDLHVVISNPLSGSGLPR